jgi:arsenate reductase
MREKGLDLHLLGHRSKGVWDEYISRHVLIGYLITVCDRAEADCPIYPGAHIREYWAIQNPDVQGDTSEVACVRFREARDCIEQRVKRFVEEHSRDPRFANMRSNRIRSELTHE